MPEKITSPAKKVVAHVKERRARYAAAAGFITGAVAMRQLDGTAAVAMNFIEEKGLTEEFWTALEA